MLRRIWLGLKLFICYLLPFLPCCPKIGELIEADDILVQAFGRNLFDDESLGKVISRLLQRAKSLGEAFALLTYEGFDPGKPNMALAKKAIRLAKQFRIPIIAQWEVVFAIWQLDRRWFFDNQSQIDCIWPPELGYFATWHEKMDSKEAMRVKGVYHPIELAHPVMLPRAVAILWKLQVPVVVEPVRPWSFFRHELFVFDKKTVQWWTGAFWRFSCLYEVLGRPHHIFIKRWVSFIPPLPIPVYARAR